MKKLYLSGNVLSQWPGLGAISNFECTSKYILFNSTPIIIVYKRNFRMRIQLSPRALECVYSGQQTSGSVKRRLTLANAAQVTAWSEDLLSSLLQSDSIEWEVGWPRCMSNPYSIHPCSNCSVLSLTRILSKDCNFRKIWSYSTIHGYLIRWVACITVHGAEGVIQPSQLGEYDLGSSIRSWLHTCTY